MIYYEDAELVIRDMEKADAQVFYDEYTAQGWHPEVDYYLMRIREHAEGKCVAMTAVYQGCPAGSLYLYRSAKEGPFKGTGYPEIVDFSVLKKYQRRGVGARLMDAAEHLASQHADVVCLGVGLSREYGAAQRIYAKRGYIPDGSGVWYGEKVCEPYADCCNDDDLVLYFSKELV